MKSIIALLAVLSTAASAVKWCAPEDVVCMDTAPSRDGKAMEFTIATKKQGYVGVAFNTKSMSTAKDMVVCRSGDQFVCTHISSASASPPFTLSSPSR